MPKFEVIKSWHGVKVGDVVVLDEVHPALKANVRALKGQAAELVPSTPAASTGEKERKGKIIAKLKELKIDFDGRKNADELGALLPPDELKALFPTE